MGFLSSWWSCGGEGVRVLIEGEMSVLVSRERKREGERGGDGVECEL